MINLISVDEKTNNLSISRGDTFTLRINLHGGITLGANDFVRFAVKKTIGSSEVVFTKDVQNPGEQFVDIPFNYEELDQLTDSSYRYDVTLICKDAKKIYTLFWDAGFYVKGVAHGTELE